MYRIYCQARNCHCNQIPPKFKQMLNVKLISKSNKCSSNCSCLMYAALCFLSTSSSECNSYVWCVSADCEHSVSSMRNAQLTHGCGLPLQKRKYTESFFY